MVFNKNIGIVLVIFIISSCNQLSYYKLSDNQRIIDVSLDTIACNIPLVKVLNQNIYSILDTVIDCRINQNNDKDYVPTQIVISEKNNFIILTREKISKLKVETSWGGFYYKGIFICVLKEPINNKIFELSECNVTIPHCRDNKQGYKDDFPFSMFYVKINQDKFIIRYRNCNFMLEQNDQMKRTDILLED
jgi:hypothetical protein